MNDVLRHNYDAYIKTKFWQVRRLKKLQDHDWHCAMCGVDHAVSPLQIHHNRYPEFNGDEKRSDLIAVCNRCHLIIHKHYKIIKGRLIPISHHTTRLKDQLPAANDPQYELEF